MDESTAETKKAKERSPGFPFITLARAIERAREFYAEEKRGAAPYARAVLHWRYSEASSGGLQTIAALRHYGLMDDVGGSGKSRQLKLTDLALRILLDTRPDSVERKEYIQQAALRPAVAREVYERWEGGLPKDATLNHFLVLDKKFNEATAANAIKILKENQQFAEVSLVSVESNAQDSENDRDAEGETMDSQGAVGDTRARPATAANAAETKKAKDWNPAVVAEMKLRFKGVTIGLTFSEEPTKELFEWLAGYCEFDKENYPSMAQREQQAVAKERRPLPQSMQDELDGSEPAQ
jgi:hypothetical protein